MVSVTSFKITFLTDKEVNMKISVDKLTIKTRK